MTKNFQENACRGCIKQYRFASLAEDFGLELFKKKAGAHAERILAELGTYSRGKRKGKHKGFIHWVKVVEGGFDYNDTRTVLRRGSFDYRVAKEYGVQHHECDIHLDFEQQLESLIKSVETDKEEINTLTANLPMREQKVQRVKKTLADDPTDEDWAFCLKVAQDRLTESLDRIQLLNERIERCNAKIDALNKGIDYQPAP